jgi:hypothetical protein
MSGRRPATVELLVGLRSVPGLDSLLAALGRWASLSARDPGLGRPDARVATSTDAPGLRDALLDDGVPVAVALHEGEEPPPEIATRAAALLVARRPGGPGIPSFGAPVVAWPAPAVDTAAHPPLAPLVRERWRRLLGLPDELVVVLGFEPVTPLADAAIPSALATCNAAAVRGPWALLALALGTPLVSDTTGAQRLGARDDREVVVAGAPDAADAARDLGRDVRRAARLGWAGRRLAEQIHDVGPSALALARRVGIVGPDHPGDVLRARLDELGTPPGATPAVRAFAACEPFLSRSEVGAVS